jgi:hypothetical protein
MCRSLVLVALLLIACTAHAWGFPSKAASYIAAQTAIVNDWESLSALDGGENRVVEALGELGRVGYDECVPPLVAAIKTIQGTAFCAGTCCSFSGPGGVAGFASAVSGLGPIHNASVLPLLRAIGGDTRPYCDGNDGFTVQRAANLSISIIENDELTTLGALYRNTGPCVPFRLLDGSLVDSVDTQELIDNITAAGNSRDGSVLPALARLATDWSHCDGQDGYTVHRAALQAVAALTQALGDGNAYFTVLNDVLLAHNVRGNPLATSVTSAWAAGSPALSATTARALASTAFVHNDETVRGSWLVVVADYGSSDAVCSQFCTLCDPTGAPDLYLVVRQSAKLACKCTQC